MSKTSKGRKDDARSVGSAISMASNFSIKVYPKRRKQKKKSNKEEKSRPPSDLSLYPSYSRYQLPYHLVCQQRYANTRKKYDEQFLYELKMQEAMQPSAYDAMRFHRHFVYTTLWPPLHTQKEIAFTLSMYELSPKQKKRLQALMNEKFV